MPMARSLSCSDATARTKVLSIPPEKQTTAEPRFRMYWRKSSSRDGGMGAVGAIPRILAPICRDRYADVVRAQSQFAVNGAAFRTNLLRAVSFGNDSGRKVAVSYTHLRAHETVLDLVCRL